jgi:biopolymer transport protein ExbD
VPGSISSDIRAEPNLTPLLDVVFQLITFFMICVNFSQDTYDQRVRLPVAGSAAPVEGAKTNEDRLVLNIDRFGQLLFNGQTYDTDGAIRQIDIQAQLVRLGAKVSGTKLNEAEGLPTTVVIRADRDTTFTQLFRLINACQDKGFRHFVLKAMNAPS